MKQIPSAPTPTVCLAFLRVKLWQRVTWRVFDGKRDSCRTNPASAEIRDVSSRGPGRAVRERFNTGSSLIVSGNRREGGRFAPVPPVRSYGARRGAQTD